MNYPTTGLQTNSDGRFAEHPRTSNPTQRAGNGIGEVDRVRTEIKMEQVLDLLGFQPSS
jgi:hypothetical protein